MPRPEYQWSVGGCRVGEPEQGWLTSNAVRRWWVCFSIPVSVIGVFWLLFGPRFGYIEWFVTKPTPQAIEQRTDPARERALEAIEEAAREMQRQLQLAGQQNAPQQPEPERPRSPWSLPANR